MNVNWLISAIPWYTIIICAPADGVQNTLARVFASLALPRDAHSFGILKYFHWLPIEQQLRFKLATLTHDAFCSTQPVVCSSYSYYLYLP